jgi:hypothetical protein
METFRTIIAALNLASMDHPGHLLDTRHPAWKSLEAGARGEDITEETGPLRERETGGLPFAPSFLQRVGSGGYAEESVTSDKLGRGFAPGPSDNGQTF